MGGYESTQASSPGTERRAKGRHKWEVEPSEESIAGRLPRNAPKRAASETKGVNFLNDEARHKIRVKKENACSQPTANARLAL